MDISNTVYVENSGQQPFNQPIYQVQPAPTMAANQEPTYISSNFNQPIYQVQPAQTMAANQEPIYIASNTQSLPAVQMDMIYDENGMEVSEMYQRANANPTLMTTASVGALYESKNTRIRKKNCNSLKSMN